MDANEQRARDVEALQGAHKFIAGRYGEHDGWAQAIARAIASLAQQVPADGEVKAWLIRADNGMAIKCVMSEQERDALLFRGESSQFPEWTATPLVEAATPQAPQPVVDDATKYAQKLAQYLWREHYAGQSPDWEVCPDLMGALSQIDNMLTGLSSQPQQGAVAEVKWAGPIPQKVLDWPRGLVPFINGAAIGTKLYAHPPTIGQQAVDAFDAGWRMAAAWAYRDDLLADMDSSAYKTERGAALAAHGNGDPDAAR